MKHFIKNNPVAVGFVVLLVVLVVVGIVSTSNSTTGRARQDAPVTKDVQSAQQR